MRAWHADRLISSPVFRRRLTLVSLMFFMILILTLEKADQCPNRDIVAQTPSWRTLASGSPYPFLRQMMVAEDVLLREALLNVNHHLRPP